MDVWTWIGSIWVMLGIAMVIADKIASPLSDKHGPHSPCRPAESLLYAVALIVGVPFIAAFALAVCGKIIWEGKIPLVDGIWWQSRARQVDARGRETGPKRRAFGQPRESSHRSVPIGTPRTDGRICPHCGGQALPILYGLPSPEAIEAQERGELSLGGCRTKVENMLCRTCGDRWHQGPFIPRLV